MFVAGLRRDRNSRPERLFRVMGAAQLLIQLTELEISCHVGRIFGLDRLEFPERILVLTQLVVFQRERVTRKRIIRIFGEKALQDFNPIHVYLYISAHLPWPSHTRSVNGNPRRSLSL